MIRQPRTSRTRAGCSYVIAPGPLRNGRSPRLGPAGRSAGMSRRQQHLFRERGPAIAAHSRRLHTEEVDAGLHAPAQVIGAGPRPIVTSGIELALDEPGDLATADVVDRQPHEAPLRKREVHGRAAAERVRRVLPQRVLDRLPERGIVLERRAQRRRYVHVDALDREVAAAQHLLHRLGSVPVARVPEATALVPPRDRDAVVGAWLALV